MEGRVLKGKNATFEASSAFKNIATSSGETLRTSRDILTATEVQKTSIGDVVKYVEEVVAIAEQTATGTQQVAGTAKQLSTAMQELTTSSQRLTDIADDLQAGLETFQLSSYTYEPEPEPEPVRRRLSTRRDYEPAPQQIQRNTGVRRTGSNRPEATPVAENGQSEQVRRRRNAPDAAPAANSKPERTARTTAETSPSSPPTSRLNKAKSGAKVSSDKATANGQTTKVAAPKSNAKNK